ncbi:MAG: glycerol-3-phosphate 1-O-acyltransferase PlsY [Eggerthellaceae bacterium]|nr:glycerol-3-phosphate 1-O-acyltransferase PlsY [Eggerthellaceae bacterium]
MLYLVIFLVSFLLGSVPWGLVVSKVGYQLDLRKYGSGNIGATNALRTLGTAGGVLVFALDFLKGWLSGLASLLLVAAFTLPEGAAGPFVWQSLFSFIAPMENAITSGVALFGCVLGHIFSPWLKFKGGKGVACAGGALFVLFGWGLGLVELLVFVLVVAKSRYVSLGSLSAAAACAVIGVILFWNVPAAMMSCVVCAMLVFWAHRSNIKKLRDGTERKIGEKAR